MCGEDYNLSHIFTSSSLSSIYSANYFKKMCENSMKIILRYENQDLLSMVYVVVVPVMNTPSPPPTSSHRIQPNHHYWSRDNCQEKLP